MTQGTKYGDHCSLLRQVKLHFKTKRNVYLIHRLDREAAGLVMIAHDKTAAGQLSRLFQTRQIIKRYTARVLGNLADRPAVNTIDSRLDGKPAETESSASGYDPASRTTRVNIVIRTGRSHQIRRHLEMIGHPVMGGTPATAKTIKTRRVCSLRPPPLNFAALLIKSSWCLNTGPDYKFAAGDAE